MADAYHPDCLVVWDVVCPAINEAHQFDQWKLGVGEEGSRAGVNFIALVARAAPYMGNSARGESHPCHLALASGTVYNVKKLRLE